MTVLTNRPDPIDEARRQLTEKQAALVAALTTTGQPPPGFDGKKFRAAAVSLASKRAGSVGRAWPALTRALGRRFEDLFAEYGSLRPRPRLGGPRADGRAFADWLRARNHLPDAGRLEALSVDLRFTRTPDGLVPRRWPTARAVQLPESGRLIVAAWFPGFGARSMSFPLGRRG